VGIYDNFFDLGGHSLLATQVISRIHETFRVELPLRSIFEAPTIADLAVALVQKKSAQVDDERLAQMLAELGELPEDEVQIMLTGEKQVFKRKDSNA